MSSLPTGLPNSLVLRELASKAESINTADGRKLEYMHLLKSLRDRVAPEISYINVTFPLFTSHDEPNHIHPLFFLADKILGSEVIGSLNATELFVFACSVYGHDWGMAISDKEKRCILGIADPGANVAHHPLFQCSELGCRQPPPTKTLTDSTLRAR